MLHDAFFVATLEAISDREQCYRKRSHREM